MSETWTIGELAERAAAVLRGGTGPGTADGRIRAVPTERLIRWYTTIGLVDPPLARRGRVALYGRRHLLQLVAVKRRQAAGAASPRSRPSSPARPTPRSREIARIPPPAAAPAAPPPARRPPPAGRAGRPGRRGAGQAPDGAPYGPAARRDRFWTRRSPRPPVPPRPSPAPAGRGHRGRAGGRRGDRHRAGSAPARAPVAGCRPGTPGRHTGPAPVSGLRLAPG